MAYIELKNLCVDHYRGHPYAARTRGGRRGSLHPLVEQALLDSLEIQHLCEEDAEIEAEQGVLDVYAD